MPAEEHPCARGLTPECFKEYPEWAKRAFAYRLFHTLFPPNITRRLPKILRGPLVYPGVVIPPDIPFPPGTIIPPDTDFPPGWTPADPAPPGILPPPFAPGQEPPDGALPPLYTQPWEPGPVHTPPVTPSARPDPWFYDDFDIIDPAVWTDWSEGTGANSIDAGQLKMYSGLAGDYAYLNTADDATIPASCTISFDLTYNVGSGQWVTSIYFGVRNIWIIFDPPSTLKYRTPDGYSSYDVGDKTGVKTSYRFEFGGQYSDIYVDGVKKASAVDTYPFAGSKGRIFLSNDDIMTVHLDDLKIQAY